LAVVISININPREQLRIFRVDYRREEGDISIKTRMPMTFTVLVVLLLAGCSISAPQQASFPADKGNATPPIPPDLRDKVARSSTIGRELFVLDKVASIGTQVLLINEKHPWTRGIIGCLPFREADAFGKPKDSFLVSFFTDETPTRIAYEVRVAPDAKPSFQAFDPLKTATPSFAALVRARQQAIAATPFTGQPINPVLIPSDANEEDGVVVYLLAGTTKANIAVFGKHFRALVSPNGSGIKYIKPLSDAVLEVPIRGPKGERPLFISVTHTVTDYPLETHIFTSLLLNTRVYVRTNRGIWRVEGDKITFLTK
jgi:hypothetical protein